MYMLYSITLIIGSILVLPFYLYKMIVKGKYRKSFLQRLGIFPRRIKSNPGGDTLIWFHAVSVGEVLSSLPLVHSVKKEHPSLKIVLSTVTETGNQTANSKLEGIDGIIFFPFDYPWVVRRVIDIINPGLFVIVETDIWPNFLKELKKRNIPSLIVNGRISPRSYRRYKTFKWFFKKVLENISFYSMQSHMDSERLIGCGAVSSRVMITGNLKFDQEIPSVTDAEKQKLLDSIGLKQAQRVFIGGSTHKGEEEIVLDVYEELKGEYKDMVLILAPRNPERFKEVENIISKRNLNWIKRTMGDTSLSPEPIEVILLDTIGELSRMYSIGLLVFVGGSFAEIGGHNLLEPAAHRKAVIFGPCMYNFTEISSLLKESGGGIQVKDKGEFLFQARRMLDNPSLLRELGEKAHGIIDEHCGSTLRNIEIINGFIVD